jgi:Geminivirus Rep catalytic domain
MRFFLTYSELGDYDKGALVDLFNLFFMDPDKYLACIKEHEDGGLHIHAYLYYYKIIHCDHRYFDIGPYHPNIRVVKKSELDHIKTLRYIKKHGEYWGTLQECDHLGSDDIYSLAPFRRSLTKAQELLISHAPRDYFVPHQNVTSALHSFFPPLLPPCYVSPFLPFPYV